MKVQDFVKRDWAKLPKSKFNEEVLVVVKEVKDEDWDYGHHSYEAWAVGEDGGMRWVYSSGCSCSGSVGVDHKEGETVKVLVAGTEMEELPIRLWREVDWAKLQRELSDY